jgi:hypothetical protein
MQKRTLLCTLTDYLGHEEVNGKQMGFQQQAAAEPQNLVSKAETLFPTTMREGVIRMFSNPVVNILDLRLSHQ